MPCRLVAPAALTLLTVAGLLLAVQPESTCRVSLKLIDAETGAELPGWIQLEAADGTRISPAGLESRGVGLPATHAVSRWWVVPRSTSLVLPRKRVTFTAVSGLATEQVRETIDLRERAEAELTIRLPVFARPREAGWFSGNTHLHLQKLSRSDADRYLRDIPRSDRLDALFVSYLERAVDDQHYITNRYRTRDLAELESRSGVLFGNGEEHRHNFGKGGEGYGHVMLLDISKLILPVSIGPGIMQQGSDGLPLERGLLTAQQDGATRIWCHNDWGREWLPSWLAGRLDAQNIFDGGAHGSYADSFYRLLNAGIPVSFSTGTDWFIYDFSRVYAVVDDPPTIDSWLASLRAGRTYITNGPLVKFTVNNRGPGDELRIQSAAPIRVEAEATGRADFQRLELIWNGSVVASAAGTAREGHFTARLTHTFAGREPGWLAVRIPPAEESDATAPRNEFGRVLFAHTSPVHVLVGGRRHVDRTQLQQFLTEIENDQRAILELGDFRDDQERGRVLGVYRTAADALKRQLRDLP